jgi:23S rRNA G2069 N7-methylase RlmK/C1962 C5-methylase RlmI
MQRAPVDPELVVSQAAADAARRGHPWIWQNAIVRGGKSSIAGEEVRVVAQDGAFLGRGIVDPGSPIFLRLWTSRDERIDERLFDRRIARAFAIRRELFDERTNAYRCVHGEGDRMPGFVVDRYADVAVLRTDGDGARAREDELVRALWPHLERSGVSRLIARDATGGFSLHAALAGATKVTSVDIAANAHATAQTSFKLAGIDPRAHDFVTADAFAFLAGAKKKGTTWDLIVSDPPSFAPNEKALPRALSAYRSLHRACVEVLAEDGVFCAASCSSHVDARAFSSTLDDGALGRDDLRLLELHGPPPDHPTLPGWPEGRYLKFAVLA